VDGQAVKEQLGQSESAAEQSLVYVVEKKAQETEVEKYGMEGLLVGIRVGVRVGARIGCREVSRVGVLVGCLVGAVNVRPTQEFERFVHLNKSILIGLLSYHQASKDTSVCRHPQQSIRLCLRIVDHHRSKTDR
jgi:hypothetical protein